MQPPAFGPPFITRVPLPDADGNDLGGMRLPAVALPLGTYTGWNLRGLEVGAPDHLARWSGSFIPFARTEAEARAAGDPRPSLEERYGTHAAYVKRVEEAAGKLMATRLLLKEDAERLVERANGEEIRKKFNP